MRKTYPLLLFILIAFSCSESDAILKTNNTIAGKQPIKVINALDPTKLAKIIYFPGTAYESQWFFYSNGLLKKITNLFSIFDPLIAPQLSYLTALSLPS